MSYVNPKSWPIAAEKLLTELCQHSHLYSASEMAEVLNKEFPNSQNTFTRNAVIAKIRRKNVPWTKQRKIYENNPARPRPKRVFEGKTANYDPRRKSQNGLINKIKQKSAKFHSTGGIVGEALYAGPGTPIIKITSEKQCRWPAKNSTLGEKQFCGKPVCESLPYCITHARAGFQSIPAKRSIHSSIPTIEQVG